MPVLTPDQFERLQRILTDAFDKRGIAELVRTKLGDRLDNLVDPDQPTPQIVFDLLTCHCPELDDHLRDGSLCNADS